MGGWKKEVWVWEDWWNGRRRCILYGRKEKKLSYRRREEVFVIVDAWD